MTTKINFNELRNELLKIYNAFISNPSDKEVHKLAISLDRKYAGLTDYNAVFASKPVPKAIHDAISGLFKIYQYGNGTFDDAQTKKTAKEIINELEKTNI